LEGSKEERVNYQGTGKVNSNEKSYLCWILKKNGSLLLMSDQDAGGDGNELEQMPYQTPQQVQQVEKPRKKRQHAVCEEIQDLWQLQKQNLMVGDEQKPEPFEILPRTRTLWM
jgi:hypothetical protein